MSTTQFKVNGTATPGTSYDQIVVSTSGALTLNGTFTIAFGNSSPLSNTTINLLGFSGTHTGDFTSLVATGYASYAGTWTRDADHDAWYTNTGSQLLTFSETTGNLNVVPEPATWALFAAGMAVVLVSLRRRRSCQAISLRNG